MSENKNLFINPDLDIKINVVPDIIATTLYEICLKAFWELSQFSSNHEEQYVTTLQGNKYDLQMLLSRIPAKNKIESNIQYGKTKFYKMFFNFLSSLLDDAPQKSLHYINIWRDLETQLISQVSANKSIVDPLGNPISDIKNIIIDVSEVNDWILNELKNKPTDLYQLSSRRFEELIAEILIRKGYSVELTPATHDGGKDIYAARKDDLGSFLYVVECKKYNPNHKVGVNVLRDLYGVLSKERATYGIAVTTSYFSKPAQEFQQDIQFQMSLQDFESIKKWLCDVT